MPAAILVLIFIYGFSGWSFMLSLTESDQMGLTRVYVGLQNYSRMFLRDRAFRTAFFNTLKLGGLFIGLTVPLGLFLAILLNLGIKGSRFFRAIYLIPLSFSFVASASMWTWMYSPNIGVINNVLRGIGLGNLAQPWITSTSQVIFCLAIAYVWQFSGFSTLVYFAGIKGVSPDILEAADIDGASTFQKYFKVIIPMQKQATLTIVTILFMYALRLFDLVWIMTGGGPGNSSEVLATLMYRTAFSRNRFGYGATMSVVMFLLSIAVIVPLFLSIGRSDD